MVTDPHLDHQEDGDPLVVSVVQVSAVKLAPRAGALQIYLYFFHDFEKKHPVISILKPQKPGQKRVNAFEDSFLSWIFIGCMNLADF